MPTDPYLAPLADPNREALADPRVSDFLGKIGKSEGADYDTLVGGRKIKDLSRHPNVVGLTTKAGPSTAFGRYQITGTTNKSKLAKYSHLDYSPENQDLRAVELLRQTGALDALQKDDTATAIKLAGKEWASLPGSPLPGRKNHAAFQQQSDPYLAPLPKQSAPTEDDPYLAPIDSPPAEPKPSRREQRRAAYEARQVLPAPPNLLDLNTSNLGRPGEAMAQVQSGRARLGRTSPQSKPKTVKPAPVVPVFSTTADTLPKDLAVPRQTSTDVGELRRSEDQVADREHARNRAAIDQRFQELKDRQTAVQQQYASYGPQEAKNLPIRSDDELRHQAEQEVVDQLTARGKREVERNSRTAGIVESGLNEIDKGLASQAQPPFGTNIVRGATSAVGHTLKQAGNLASVPDWLWETATGHSPHIAENLRSIGGEIQAGAEKQGEKPSQIEKQLGIDLNSTAGQVERGLTEGTGHAVVELPKLLVGGQLLGAANLPVQGALSRADEGVPGLVKGAAGGLLYHYGGGAVGEALGGLGPALASVGNTLVWVAGPAAEAHLVGGVPWSRALADAIPMGAFAGISGGLEGAKAYQSKVQVKDGATVRDATIDDLPAITSKTLEVVPPPKESQGASGGTAAEVGSPSLIPDAPAVEPVHHIETQSRGVDGKVGPIDPDLLVATGEVRTPKEGEYFINGDGKRMKAERDYQVGEYQILGRPTSGPEPPAPLATQPTSEVESVDSTSQPRNAAPARVPPPGSQIKVNPDGSQEVIEPNGRIYIIPASEGVAPIADRLAEVQAQVAKIPGATLLNADEVANGAKPRIQIKPQGVNDATNERIEPQSNQPEYRGNDQVWLPETPSSRSIPEQRRQVEAPAQNINVERPSPNDVGREAEIKERAFPKSAEAAGLPEARDLTYAVNTDVGAVERASARIERDGIDRVGRELQNTAEPSKDDIVAGSILAHRLAADGYVSEAVDVIDNLAVKLTKAGQSVQAASLISRLSPEGILLAAQRRMPAGQKLAPEQASTLIEKAGRLEAAEARVGELERELAEARKASEPKPKTQRVQEKIGTLADRLSRLEQDARARLAERAARAQSELTGAKGQRGAAVNPASVAIDIADYAVIGAAKLAQKGMTVAKWSAEMIKEFGEDIRPQIQALYKKSYELYDEQRKQFAQEAKERSARRAEPNATDIQRVINDRRDAQTAARKARLDLARYFNDLNKSPLQKLGSRAIDVLNLPRALTTSMDLSAAGRQGKVGLLRHPKIFLRSFLKQFQALSTNQYEKMISERELDPQYKYAGRFGLELTSHSSSESSKLGAREEAFQSGLVEKIPGVKHSEQAYNTMLDELRFGWFKDYVNNLQRMGLDPEKPADAQAFEEGAQLINNATGRGNLGRFQSATPALNTVFFSPRFWASRVKLLTTPLDPRTYTKMTPQARVENFKTLFSFAALVGSQLALAKLSGAKVGTDPDEPDFGKASWGPVHVDFSAGFQNHLRTALRLIKAIRSDKPKQTPGEILGAYARSKEAPNASLIHDLFLSKKKKVGETSYGTDFKGSPTSLFGVPGNRAETSALMKRVTPMVFQDAKEAYGQLGWKGLAAVAPTSAFGEGVSVYAPTQKLAGGMLGNEPLDSPLMKELQKHGLSVGEPKKKEHETDDQLKARTERQRAVLEANKPAIIAYINSPKYQNSSVEDQKKLLDGLIDHVRRAAETKEEKKAARAEVKRLGNKHYPNVKRANAVQSAP